MLKLKTSKSLKKRFKITSKGKILRHMATRNHLLQKKSSKRKQDLRQVLEVHKHDICNFICKLPYSF